MGSPRMLARAALDGVDLRWTGMGDRERRRSRTLRDVTSAASVFDECMVGDGASRVVFPLLDTGGQCDHASEFVQLPTAHPYIRGPDPARISLCQCYECQRGTGSVFSVQARLRVEQVTIEGQSSTWTFPADSGKPAEFRSCDSGGATYHFCPECGSTVY